MIRDFIRLFVLLIALPALGQESSEEGDPEVPAPEVEIEGPAQLLERGRAAFAANDFEQAEEALEKFIVDYGEAEEAKEAARLHRPLVAICKVGLKKFGEALTWIDESLEDPKLDAALDDELKFWKGICLMSTGELVPAQRAFGEYWVDETHQPFKRYEALLLFATLYVQQDFPKEAADFLEDQLPKIRDLAPEAASRAVVLELYARIQAGQLDEALAVIRREFSYLDQMTQLISFQTLALQLGSRFIEEKRWYDAIACLQRVWPSDRLIERQGEKIAEIENRIQMLKHRSNVQSTIHQLESILKRVQRELKNFAGIENFDSALRLRLAMSYQGLGRYREAALIMEDMLVSMEPDPVVESATLAQIQCWMEVKRWARAVTTAEAYEKTFGAEGKYLPTVLFLKAESLKEAENYGAAQLAYGKLVEQFPEDPFAPKALFMQGFLYLQQGDNDGAMYQFDQVQRVYPEAAMIEDADYWTGMAYSFAGLYEEAKTHLEEYLDRYKTPKYRKEAVFRIAVCTFSMAEYEEALKKLQSFIEAYPGDPLTDEAHLLIGDAYLGDGMVDEGLAAYDQVRPSSQRFFEDAWFKKGKVFKLQEDYESMQQHFAAFVVRYPESPRMPEAVYWIGWIYSTLGEPEKARDVYWETINKHGNDPDFGTMTDVFSALPKVYGAENMEDLLSKLETLKTRGGIKDELILATRAGWAKSGIMARTSDLAGRTELLAIAKWVDPKLNRPVISVAVAEALLEAGNPLTAQELFSETRRWHPRAVEKGRIYKGLGSIAAAEGDLQKALEYYELFERDSLASLDLGEVKMKKSEIFFENGQAVKAQAELESVLETDGVSAAIKADALYRLGESLAEQGEFGKAIVYYERVYVAYGKFSEVNAKAYLGRGRSLEEMDLKREALETYEELVSRDDLRRYDEFKLAEERVDVLRSLVPEESEPEQEEAL